MARALRHGIPGHKAQGWLRDLTSVAIGHKRENSSFIA